MSNLRIYRIIWPQKRLVSEHTIRTWYSDGVANGELQAGLRDVDDMARELDSYGTIALGKVTQ